MEDNNKFPVDGIRDADGDAIPPDHRNHDNVSPQGSSNSTTSSSAGKGGETPLDNNGDSLDGFLQRHSKHVARNSCLYLWTSLIVAIGLSAVGMIVGEFEVGANNGGWRSRGTKVADREAQLLLVNINRDALFNQGEAAWDELINNVQTGWEDDDDGVEEGRRRLTSQAIPDLQANPFAKDRETKRVFPHAFASRISRMLQDQNPDALQSCNVDIYSSAEFMNESRLWPIWRVDEDEVPEGSVASVLDPQAMFDICTAEANTQSVLESHGLCFGCDDGSCLPPMSIVLYARLLVDGGMDMTCDELRDAWAPLRQVVETEWIECTRDVLDNAGPGASVGLPGSCPPNYSPSMVDESFLSTGKITYTSSIFPTRADDIKELFDVANDFDRGSDFVEGVYDTQNEDFVETLLDQLLIRDMSLALGSAIVTSIAIIVHTKSPFITVVGIAQIILSFPLSYLVYSLVAGLDFFPFLNFIGVFVLFSLGSGDIFVAVDRFKNTRLKHPSEPTETIAAMAFPDAAEAMFLTTLTTAVAFFATAICPVAPIRCFAIFVGLLIFFDYLLCVLLVFPAICIYDRANMRSEGRPNCCISLVPCFNIWSKNKGEADAEDEGKNDPEDSNSLIHRIMLAYYNLLHAARWPLLVLSFAALAVSAYFASTIELPLTADVRLLPESFEFEKNFIWRRELLVDSLEAASGSVAHVIFGTTPADTGDLFNPGSWTSLELDDDFEPSDEDAQIFLHQFCDDLFAQEFASPAAPGYVCSLTGFDLWLQEQSSMDQPDGIYTENCAGASSLPVPKESFDACIIAWSRQVQDSNILSNAGRVEILTIPFASRIRPNNAYSVLKDEWDLIESWMDDMLETAPSGVANGYFSSGAFWWMDTNGQMLSTAYGSAGIALAAAAIVILVSSQSLVLTVFSTLTILYVLSSVIAMVVGIGWRLGFLESICIAILIGVSVDFVIHFCHAYKSLPGSADRSIRTKHALFKMGPSVLATAVTTVASACVMFFTVYAFFRQFATILLFTLIQATIGSFVFFLSMTDAVGPTQPTFLYDRCIEKIFQRRKENVEDETGA